MLELIRVNPIVQRAIDNDEAVVALESAVITHGLPKPKNLEVAKNLEKLIYQTGAVAATIGIISGQIVVGLNDPELKQLANAKAGKASLWNLSALVTQKQDAGTTVAVTCQIAALTGIKVFATGGIGGVHKNPADQSADLIALSRYPIVVVCAGVKSILDVNSTKERLESLGVPLIGYQTNKLAGFYISETTYSVAAQLNSPEEIAQCFRKHCKLDQSALLVAKPVSKGLDSMDIELWLEQAQREADEKKITGNRITPYLLARLAELSKGSSLEANVRLLKENVRLATNIALALEAQESNIYV